MAINIALAGNPNCGKTTLFNHFTGANQYVGNWPGVTVEKKEGSAQYNGHDIIVVDLPGVYSLSPYSMEEIITRDYIVHEKPDVIINVVDGTNLERNLYLTLQLMELAVPLIVAVNMMDAVKQKGDHIHMDMLAALLGVPLVPVSARTGEQTGRLLEEAIHAARHRHGKNEARGSFHATGNIRYSRQTQNALAEIYAILLEVPSPGDMPLRFFASKLLEGGLEAQKALPLTQSQLTRVEAVVRRYEATSLYGDRETMLADARYRYIGELCRQTVHKNCSEGNLTYSDKIDLVLTNRFLAIPIFLLVMFLMFSATFGPVGAYLKGLIEVLFGEVLAGGVTRLLNSASAPVWAHSLLVDAVIGGVGGVLTFLPQIMILFFFLSILEDSGYMARAAFIMDRLLRNIGLTGKSFIPMLMGFGCTTPAVMAARAMESEQDRRLTIMITPFMSCGAKLPIYALFAAVFFPAHQSVVVFSMYIIGMLVAILSGLLLKHTLFRGEVAPFVMELPPYRLPSLKSLALHMWDKAKGFLVKAGTIIFSMSVLVWLLQNLGSGLHLVQDHSQSLFAMLGRAIAPIFAPLGFGTWQASVSVLAGLVAKETVVSTMLVLYGAGGQEALTATLAGAFTPLSAFSFMVFCLLYMPCMSALVAIKKELNSLRWALGTMVFCTAMAYLAACAVYQLGSLLPGV